MSEKRRLGRYRPFNHAAGPWLIWSHKWNCWHRRSSEGHAAGYVDDIAEAGIFDEKIAKAYHDPPPYRTNEAVPAAKVVKDMRHRLQVLTDARDAFAANVAGVELALARKEP